MYTVDIGSGLFAEEVIAKNGTIAQFRGQLVSAADMRLRDAAGRGGYAVAVSKDWVLDCRDEWLRNECQASAANSPRRLWNTHAGKPARANASLCIAHSRHGVLASLRATRTLRPNDEVLVGYQPSYVFPAAPDVPVAPATPLGASAHPASTPRPSRAAAVSAHRAREALTTRPLLSFTAADDQLVECTLREVNTCLNIFGAPPVGAAELRSFLEDAHRVASDNFGVAAAQAAGGNFDFPQDAIDRDLQDFEAHGSCLEQFAASRQRALAPVRLSHARIDTVLGKRGELAPTLRPEDLHRLHDLADGIQVLPPEGFVPVPNPAPLRARYLQVAGAIHHLLHKQQLAGTLAVLPLIAVLRSSGVHVRNAQHWALKKYNQYGRAIADTANKEHPDDSPALNGDPGPNRDAVTAAYAALYGAVSHPTLASLMLMILDQADRTGWDTLRLWKKDLAGAFNLLWFRPDHVRFLAFPLTGDRVAVHLGGLFGLGGLPPAFGVVTRSVVAKTRALIAGSCDMYVDDTMGVTPVHHLESDMTAADDTMTGLLGPKAVAGDKDEHGRHLEWIGWDVCLDSRTVTLSARNLLKMTHVFFCFALTDGISHVHVQRMAALATRLAPLCPFLKPFTRALHMDASLFPTSGPSSVRRLSREARSDVAVLRAMVLIFKFRPTLLARPIESFRPRGARFKIEYDASLTALAAGVSAVEPSGAASSLLGFVVFPIPFAIGTDSSFQNTCEFLAIIAGFLVARRLGLTDCSASLYGDSVSSLHWADCGRATSTLARRANLGLALLSMSTGLTTHDVIHVPGVENVTYDGLSRGRSALEVGLDPNLELHFSPQSPEHQFLALCDPFQPMTSAADHFAATAAFQDLLSNR
jgi:hypothetical protein